jgi:peptide/nickel transport system permease protein
MVQLTSPEKVAVRPRRAVWNGSLWSYALRRLGRLLASFFILGNVAFLMVRLIPGDPVREALGPTAAPEIVEARRAQLGLDLPLIEQYLRFWQKLLVGDLGDSFAYSQPVLTLIGLRLPNTLELAIPAVLIALLLAVPLGLTLAALTRGGRRRGLELGYTATAGFLAMIPEFVVGVLFVFVFSIQLGLLPAGGRSSGLSYILPVATLAFGAVWGLSRIVRVEGLAVLGQDYMRTARAKRMGWVRRYVGHALPNLLTSALTIGGLFFGALIVGTVLIESVFAWPGLGSLVIESIRGKDYPLAQGVVMVYGLVVLIVTLIVDVLLIVVDRRSTVREH